MAETGYYEQRQVYRWIDSNHNADRQTGSAHKTIGLILRSDESAIDQDATNAVFYDEALPKIAGLPQPLNHERFDNAEVPRFNTNTNKRNGENWTRLPFLRDGDKATATKENTWEDEFSRLRLPPEKTGQSGHANVTELYESFARKPRDEDADVNDGKKKRRRRHRHHRRKRSQDDQSKTNDEEDQTDESSGPRRHRRRHRRHRDRVKENTTEGDNTKSISTGETGIIEVVSRQEKEKVVDASHNKTVQFPKQTKLVSYVSIPTKRDDVKSAEVDVQPKVTVNTDKTNEQKSDRDMFRPQVFKVASSKGVEGHAIQLRTAEVKKQNGIRSVLLTQKAISRERAISKHNTVTKTQHNVQGRTVTAPTKVVEEKRQQNHEVKPSRPLTEANTRMPTQTSQKAYFRSKTCMDTQKIAVQPKQHKFVVTNDREVARYQQMLSVYLDEKWHKARKQRFFKMLEQFQMKNNVQHVVKQRTKAKEIHKAIMRQNEQLEYVRNKHMAEKEKRLASQHVKWKFVRNAINDRQKFGLPNKLHDVVIAKQNLERSVVSERRKRTFSKSELRRRNEAKFEFMFEPTTGRRYITAVPNV